MTVMLLVSSAMVQLQTIVFNVWSNTCSFLIRSVVFPNAPKATTPTPTTLCVLAVTLPARPAFSILSMTAFHAQVTVIASTNKNA